MSQNVFKVCQAFVNIQMTQKYKSLTPQEVSKYGWNIFEPKDSYRVGLYYEIYTLAQEIVELSKSVFKRKPDQKQIQQTINLKWNIYYVQTDDTEIFNLQV